METETKPDIVGETGEEKADTVCEIREDEKEFDHSGMRVLLVEINPVCRKVNEAMLKLCGYEVTVCETGSQALSILHEDKIGIDIVLIDTQMPKLVQILDAELNLPAILVTAADRNKDIIKGILSGTCDHWVKPARLADIRKIWQHVYRRRKRNKEAEISANKDSSCPVASNNKSLKRKNEDRDEDEEIEQASSEKKKRFTWTTELHDMFTKAVNKCRYYSAEAVPRNILKEMKRMGANPEVTREKVASHLQKYRSSQDKRRDSPVAKVEQRSLYPSSAAGWNVPSSSESRNLNHDPYLHLNQPKTQVCPSSIESQHILGMPQASGVDSYNPYYSYGTSGIDSKSYPMSVANITLAFPVDIPNYEQNILPIHTNSGGFVMPSTMPAADMTMNQFDTRIQESRSQHVSSLPLAYEPETVCATSSGLILHPTNKTQLVDPNSFGPMAPHPPSNELPGPFLSNNCGEVIFGNTVTTSGLGRINSDPSNFCFFLDHLLSDSQDYILGKMENIVEPPSTDNT